MKQIKLKVTYIQIFFSLSIFVTFLPNGLIYASGKAAQIVRAMYLVQFFIYSVTIFLCAKKSLKLIKAPVIGFMVWGIILLLVTINYTKDLMKVFRAAVYLLGILTIFLIVLYMFSYQSEKVFLMIYGDNDSGMARLSEVAIGFGGVREIAPSLFRNINFAFYDDRRCAEFLWDLL